MEGKDSFILYTKYISIFKVLTIEQRGILITHIFEYVNDNIPESEEDNIEDVTIKIAWLAIKSDLKDDLVKWKDTCKKRSEAGKIGAEIKKAKQAKQANANFAKNEEKQKKAKQAKQADSDNEYEYENDNEINKSINRPSKLDRYADLRKQILDYLNSKAGKHYRDCKANQRLIDARLDEGYTLEDFNHVIDVKAYQWKDSELSKYLRPETLFCASHFESYLNEVKQSGVKNNPCDQEDGGFHMLTWADVGHPERDNDPNWNHDIKDSKF